MRDLNIKEVEWVSGSGVLTGADIDFIGEGILWGIGDGAMTGMALGGKYGGNGIWGFGALTQLIGYTVTPLIGAVIGGVLGMLYGRDVVAGMLAEFRQQFG